MQSNSPAQWAQLLADAVNKPGRIHAAYSAFWNYSAGNQLLALSECTMRGIQPGPINTFLGWKQLGRYVRKGEKAIALCMPVTCKRKPALDEDADDENPPAGPETFTLFVFKARWFVLTQTDGQKYCPDPIPGWNEARALTALERVMHFHLLPSVEPA